MKPRPSRRGPGPVSQPSGTGRDSGSTGRGRGDGTAHPWAGRVRGPHGPQCLAAAAAFVPLGWRGTGAPTCRPGLPGPRGADSPRVGPVAGPSPVTTLAPKLASWSFFFSFFFHLPKVYINSFILSSFKHVVHWLRVRVVYKTVPPIAPSLLWVFASRERGGQRVWVRRAPRPAWSRLLLRLLCKGKVRTTLMARKVPS